jgi:hypothetical protein
VLNLKLNGKCFTGRPRSRLEQEISKNIMQKGGRTRKKLRSSNFRKKRDGEAQMSDDLYKADKSKDR